MRIYDILEYANKFIDRYDEIEAIKISIFIHTKKLCTLPDLKKCIPEIDNLNLDALIKLYQNSDKKFEL